MWLKLLILFSLKIVAGDKNVSNSNIHYEIFANQHRSQLDGFIIKQKHKLNPHFLRQKLNHFNKSDKRTWRMFYISNNEFFLDNGPMFIYLGGEQSKLKGNVLLMGHLYDTARKYKGYLFELQHRYYGVSKPTEDLSVENLRFLTVKQALADIAHFIRTQRKLLPQLSKSKVILVGSSYAGALAIWFKNLFPNLISGVWASSPPLLAKFIFDKYSDDINQTLLTVGGSKCYERIERSINKSTTITRSAQRQFFYTEMFLCDSFKNHISYDVSALFNGIDNIFADLVEKQNVKNKHIENACEHILSETGDLAGLASYFNEVTGYVEHGCKDMSYEAFIKPIKTITYSNNYSFMRQWFYQLCNEFGYFPISNLPSQGFGAKYTAAFFIKICQDAFGAQFTELSIRKRVRATNQYFGGLSVNLENVHLTHGSLDPWRLLSIYDKRATILPKTGHALDFLSISPTDSQEMLNSKQKFTNLVGKWIKNK